MEIQTLIEGLVAVGDDPKDALARANYLTRILHPRELQEYLANRESNMKHEPAYNDVLRGRRRITADEVQQGWA